MTDGRADHTIPPTRAVQLPAIPHEAAKDNGKGQRESIIEEIHKDIFNYAGWGKLLQHYGLESPPPLHQGKVGNRPKRKKYHWSRGPESDAHKQLKKYISENPHVVGVGRKTAPGLTEYILPSADRIDVLFSEDGWRIAVEVKPFKASDDELQKGIFQCVKYRELLRAEQRTEKVIPQARAILVTERSLPKRLARIADLLQVPYKEVNLTSGSS